MSISAPAPDKEELRRRNAPIRANTSEEARQTVLELNALEEKKDVEDEKEKKTFGRTPGGTGKLLQILTPANHRFTDHSR